MFPIRAIRSYITRYVNLRFQEFRLEALERVVNVMGYLIFGAVVFFLGMVMFGFIAFGLAEYLCAVFDSRTAGYFAVAGVLFILLLLMLAVRRKIFNLIGGKILWILTKPKDKSNEEEI
jgi:hypothetical protein